MVDRDILKLDKLAVTKVLKYTDDQQDKMVNIQVLNGEIQYSTSVSRCKVIRIPNTEDNLIEKMLERFQLSSENVFEGILPTVKYFKDTNFWNFCYKSYDYDFSSLREQGTMDYESLKRASRGFVRGLMNLHKSSMSHGNITCYHLVTSNDHGYLSGGIGSPLSDTWDKDKFGVPVKVTDPFKKDLIDLARALEDCLDKNNTPSIYIRDLNLFIHFLRRGGPLNRIIPYPYVSTSMEFRSFFVTVQEDFKKVSSVHLNREFKAIMSRGSYQLGDWYLALRRSNDNTLLGIYHSGTYQSNGSGLTRFIRNVFVHAVKGSQISAVDHCKDLYDRVERVFPGFACIVYDVALSHKFMRKIL